MVSIYSIYCLVQGTGGWEPGKIGGGRGTGVGKIAVQSGKQDSQSVGNLKKLGRNFMQQCIKFN